MAIRADTYALDREIPYLLERGAEQTLTFPIRRPSDGAYVEPDATSTVQITSPTGDDLVAEVAVDAVASSVAQYTLTPSTSATLGGGYLTIFTPVISGVTYPEMRRDTYVCDYILESTVTPQAIYTERPRLRFAIPQAQGERGSDVGWQPQIDASYYELVRRMLDAGRPIWEITNATGSHEWLLARTIQRCIAAIQYGPGSEWESAAKDAAYRMREADARLRFHFSSDDSDTRRAGNPVTRLAPAGRPVW